MTALRLTCSCGHTWMYAGEGTPPADVRTICPVCAFGSDGTDQTRIAPPNIPSPPSPVPDPLAELAPGRVLGGFEILGELNRGGMGVIYKARQRGLDRVVALKVIAPSRLASQEALRRFEQEVRAAARLSHPNIVQVYHTDLDGPLPFLAMEYVAGIDLSRLVKAAGPLSPNDACLYIRQAALGLQHAHEMGLVHRDIKPANLMVTPSPLDAATGKTNRLPRVKILDLGLARTVSDGENEHGSDLTRDGIFLGTPDYVAPEQAEDSRRVDIRADLYSLGASLYFLLTGTIPFPGASVVQKLRRQLMEPPPSPAEKRSEISPALDALVRRMMARSPVERIQTPTELIDLIDRVMKGESLSLASPSTASVPIVPAAPPIASPAVFSGASEVKAHDGGVHGLAVTPDGKSVLTGGFDGTIKVWNAVRLKESRKFQGDIGAVEDLALAPNGKWAVSCATRLTVQDMGVQLWNVASGTEHGRLRGASDNYRCVAVSPDGKRVAGGCGDKTVWVWSFEPGGPKPICLKGHRGAVTGVTFARTADSLLSASEDGTVRQWDLKTQKEKGALAAGVGAIKGLAFNGRRVAVAGEFLAVRQRTASFTRFDGHDASVLCVAFSPDGKLLASGGTDMTVRLWRVEDGTELTVWTGHANPVRAVAFGPDGGVVYSVGEGGNLRRWPTPPLG